MALVIEDGSGLANADAYASVAQVTAYHAAYGNDGWLDYNTATQEILIRRASRDLDAIYGSAIPSARLKATQALMFPRTTLITRDGVTITGIPSILVSAVAELALIEGAGDPTGVSDESGNVKVDRVRVGDLSVETERFSPRSSTISTLRKVGFLLSTILVGSGSSVFVPVSRG